AIQTDCAGFDGQYFIRLGQGSEIDKDCEKHRQRNHIVQNLRQQKNEVADDDGCVDVVLHDIWKEFEQCHDDEQRHKDEQHQGKEKPEPTKDIDIEQPEKLWVMRERIRPAAQTFSRWAHGTGLV